MDRYNECESLNFTLYPSIFFLLESILIPAKLITLPTIKGILQSKGFGVFPQDFKAS